MSYDDMRNDGAEDSRLDHRVDDVAFTVRDIAAFLQWDVDTHELDLAETDRALLDDPIDWFVTLVQDRGSASDPCPELIEAVARIAWKPRELT